MTGPRDVIGLQGPAEAGRDGTGCDGAGRYCRAEAGRGGATAVGGIEGGRGVSVHCAARGSHGGPSATRCVGGGRGDSIGAALRLLAASMVCFSERRAALSSGSRETSATVSALSWS